MRETKITIDAKITRKEKVLRKGKITNNPTFYWFSYNNSNIWLNINNPNYMGCLLRMHEGLR